MLYWHGDRTLISTITRNDIEIITDNEVCYHEIDDEDIVSTFYLLAVDRYTSHHQEGP